MAYNLRANGLQLRAMTKIVAMAAGLETAIAVKNDRSPLHSGIFPSLMQLPGKKSGNPLDQVTFPF